MIWKPMDFQRIATFDHTLVNQLSDYLGQRETRLSSQIIGSVNQQIEAFAPILPLTDKIYLRLEDAIDVFEKKIRQSPQSSAKIITATGFQEIKNTLSAAFWSYLDVLISSETELFEQLNRIGIMHWTAPLYQVVKDIKEVLVHRMDDFDHAIKRVDKLLKEHRWHTESPLSSFKNMFVGRRPLLDAALFKDLEKSRRFLNDNFEAFSNRYNAYESMDRNIHEAQQALSGYLVLSRLNHDREAFFARFSRALMLWEQNQEKKILPENEIALEVKNIVSPEKAMEFFREYYKALKNALFEVSRQLKEKHFEENQQSNRNTAQEMLLFYRIEVHVLTKTIMKYREFLLKADNYQKNKWGPSQWRSGPEPEKTKQLLDIAYQVDELNGLYEHLYSSTENEAMSHAEFTTTSAYEQIQRSLHEMSQPLTTQQLMRTYSERFLAGINSSDELGTGDQETVRYIGESLSKAMRADWKYQVLSEFPEFHKIYQIHNGIVGPIEDRSYQNRAAKFKRLLDDIREKVHGEDVGMHLHEIEHDINDIRAYLQDFYAYAQRICSQENLKSKDDIRHLKHQLLEYRYLFSDFFYQLSNGHQYQHSLRNQFLFVDQYFESIDAMCQEAIIRNQEKAQEEDIISEGE